MCFVSKGCFVEVLRLSVGLAGAGYSPRLHVPVDTICSEGPADWVLPSGFFACRGCMVLGVGLAAESSDCEAGKGPRGASCSTSKLCRISQAKQTVLGLALPLPKNSTCNPECPSASNGLFLILLFVVCSWSDSWF